LARLGVDFREAPLAQLGVVRGHQLSSILVDAVEFSTVSYDS
jgi:hypothetical protein